MARLSSVVFALTALVSSALAASQFDVRTYVPAAKQARSSNALSSNVLSIKRSENAARSATYLSALKSNVLPTSNSSLGLLNFKYQLFQEYIAEVWWGGNPYVVILDTGSSDTWIVHDGFDCMDMNGTSVPITECEFGPTFKGNFSGGSIANETFHIRYGDQRFLDGLFGYESIIMGGITVDHQQVALVDRGYWFGDNVTSGILGMAYPGITSAILKNESATGNQYSYSPYNPIITTMIADGLIEPLFSMSLNRTAGNGYLALGGLPPVSYTGSFASTPILMLDIFNSSNMQTEFTYYTIIADAYVYEGSANRTDVGTESWNKLLMDPVVNSTQFPIIVDCGTTLMYLPTALFQDIIALYNPPAVYIPDFGAAFAPCNATVPKLGVQINGTVFYLSEADMLNQQVVDTGTGYCLVAIGDGGSGPYVLGNVFLNNVISVYDIGASEMRFVAKDHS